MTGGQILYIDKPTGITSFDVIRILRKKLGVSKMGHGGTLDPDASGLLVIGVGEGTKRLQEFLGMPKTYETTVRLGASTTTGDASGEKMQEKKVAEEPDRETVNAVCNELMGDLELPVPAYSAIKRGGEPLYKKARRGEEVDAPVKTMKVYEMAAGEVKNADGYADVDLTMTVGSGAYVRSIAEEFGRRLGYPAHVTHLRRTRIGEYRVEDAERVTEEDIEKFLQGLTTR